MQDINRRCDWKSTEKIIFIKKLHLNKKNGTDLFFLRTFNNMSSFNAG